MYHFLLELTWWKLLVGLTVYFFLVHLFFAFLYSRDAHGIANTKGDPVTLYFWDCFFFSVQTMETIGYGGLYPASPYSNVIVCVQSYWGFLQTAIIMGFVFRKNIPPFKN